MAGLMDAARSISSSLGLIASSARATATELRDAGKARTEYEQRNSQSSMAKAKGGAVSTVGSANSASGQGTGMTPGALASALQSLTRRS